MAGNPTEEEAMLPEGLSLRLIKAVEAGIIPKARKKPKASTFVTAAAYHLGVSGTRPPSAHKSVPSTSTSTHASATAAGSALPQNEPAVDLSTSTQASTSAAGPVLPPNEPARDPQTSTKDSTCAAGPVLPPNEPARDPQISTQASTSAAGPVLPPNEPALDPQTSTKASTSAAGPVLPPNEPALDPSTSTQASASSVEESLIVQPSAPVVIKYDRETELENVFKLRTILNEIRGKVIKVQDIVSLLMNQLETRVIPKEIRDIELNKPTQKL